MRILTGIGSAAEPLELEDEELEYVTPPMMSSPAEEEVPKLVPGPPVRDRSSLTGLILQRSRWCIGRERRRRITVEFVNEVLEVLGE